MNREGQDSGLMRMEAIELSDLFALQEGRRPRLLIAYLGTFLEKELHKMAGFFADLGCDVDIAPRKSNLSHIERQCMENDTDMLLLLSEAPVQSEAFYNFQTSLNSKIQHLVPALYISASNASADTFEHKPSWSYFDQNHLAMTIALTILRKLLSGK